MAKYTIEITARYEIETNDINEVRLNYDTPTLEYCESIVGEPEFLDGTFSHEVLLDYDRTIKREFVCKHCGTDIHTEDNLDFWHDSTGGDGCWQESVENQTHRPLSAWRYPCQCECGCEQGYDYSATAICSECQDHTQQGDNE